VFGAGFFFDLFWPERSEAPWVKKAWKVSAVVVCAMILADALAMTVIIVMREAHLEKLGSVSTAAAVAVREGLKHPNPPLGELCFALDHGCGMRISVSRASYRTTADLQNTRNTPSASHRSVSCGLVLSLLSPRE